MPGAFYIIIISRIVILDRSQTDVRLGAAQADWLVDTSG